MLGEKGIQVRERQYFKQPPTVDEVRSIAALLPGGVRDILSTRSRKYAELGLGEKSRTDDEILSLLAAEPGLWRRPIVIRGATAVVGFDQQRLDALLS